MANNIPDKTVVEKKKVWLIDMAIPGDSRIHGKKVDKILKYQDIKVEEEKLGKEGNSSVAGDWKPGNNNKEYRKTLENPLGFDKISSSQLQKQHY